MNAALPHVTHCSRCGSSLSSTGECLACLIGIGFDETDAAFALPRFGDYEVERREDGSLWELGRGAIGVTYRARDTVLERTVALKVIQLSGAAEAAREMRERFLREARSAAAFRHPNVAAVYQFGTSLDGERCYYAMEFVDGETLDALVRRDGAVKVELAVEIALQVTRALVASARHGLIHRDLKPGNIMLTKGETAPSEVQVKVIDFGLAKAVAHANQPDLTNAGFLGTPAFASPEQFSGTPADARSDIYSLGATLWYVLTGQLPYRGRNIEEIRRAQSERQLSTTELVARRIPRPLVRLLCHTLSFDPAERPASAVELLGMIEVCRVQLGLAQGQSRHSRSLLRRSAMVGGVAAMIVVASLVVRFWQHEQTYARGIVPEKSIAVLPFQNLSSDKTYAYLADAVQDEVLTSLAKVADLKVISRTSVMQFGSAEKRNIREIGQRLGVAHVLEGTVQPLDNRLRVSAQLIDARSDSHEWSERYDGDIADLFTIQTQIAQKIAGQLAAVLLPNEIAALHSPPTHDPVAYQLYLQAKQVLHSGGAGARMGQTAIRAVALLDDALKHDPQFVSALCMLAQAHLRTYWFNDPTTERLELARRALEEAERAQPDAGEVHLTRGLFHYYAKRDYAAALSEFALAQRTLPNDPDVAFYTGAVQRRQGFWEPSIEAIQRALTLDPLNAATALDLSWNYRRLRRYAEARRVLDDVLLWRPGDLGFQLIRADVDVEENADVRPTRAILSRDLSAAADQDLVANFRQSAACMERDYATAAKAIAQYTSPDILDNGFLIPRDYFAAVIESGLGHADAAQAAFLRARQHVAERLTVRPSDAKALITLAKIDARLGRKEQAMREAAAAVQLLPVTADAFDGPMILVRFAQVCARVGEKDQALDILQEAARLPSDATYGALRLDEEYDPLRGDPRFEQIVQSLAPKQRVP